jgi:hypothetical protein
MWTTPWPGSCHAVLDPAVLTCTPPWRKAFSDAGMRRRDSVRLAAAGKAALGLPDKAGQRFLPMPQ